MELILIAPLSAALWYGVVKWVRFLDTRDLLEGLRPSAADVARIERRMPKMVLR